MTAHLPRRHFLTLAGGAALATGITTTTASSAAATDQGSLAVLPETIPALQEWQPRTGPDYVAPTSGPFRIILRSGDGAQLVRAKVILQEDLPKVLGGRTVEVVTQDNPAPAAGDLVLTLGAPPNQNLEGYEIEVGAALWLRGTPAGAVHGVQTILQWLRQRTILPPGLVRDWPKYPERGFLVANSARHYTMEWWKGQINELAFLKMNMLWVYVGYESTTSLAQLKEISAYATKYNIALVPQVNMPGHMERLLEPGMGLPGRGDLDLSNEAAYPFARGLFEKYLDEFPTPWWHLGADEYLTVLDGDPEYTVEYARYPQLGEAAKRRYGADANPVDIYTGFLNEMNVTVRAHNKQLRVWSDGLLDNILRAGVNQNIILEHWTTWPNRLTPTQLLQQGYKVHNSTGEFLYYDPPNPPHNPNGRFPDPEAIYDRFHPGVFPRPRPHLPLEIVDPNHPGLRGAKLHLWTLPANEPEEIQSNNLRLPFRSLAQVLWGSPFPYARYADGFPGMVNRVGRPPQYPIGRHKKSPAAGHTSVPPQRPAQVIFFDDIVPESVQMAEGGIEAGTPGRTTFDPGTNTATFTPLAPWLYEKTCEIRYTARDTLGQSLRGTWTFKVAKRPTVAYPRSLFNDVDGPEVEWSSDSRETELGVRFRVDRPGVVLGVKFYKAPGDTDVHTGSLWSPSGERLATATFAGESAAGWQEVRFAQPVRIDAGGNYTASYHSPTGTFAYDHDFYERTQDNGVLHTPTGAGLFSYGPTSYPTQFWMNTNYWADVIFQPDTYTLWNVGDAPVFGATEQTSLEMGVQFSSSTAGKVHGVRFFKGTHNTGTHLGTLWTSAGVKLATATFVGESASGWQEVRFAQPITIAAGASYVISYSSAGGYSATENGMAGGRQNGALSTSGPGLYALKAGDFPTLSYQNRNYFADVVFSEG
ncbi:DUF4082 domain-containing protein [Kribbella albertanoniae]|uniref:DUF4082 domain-containing protein n=1 Tax=Kribbella albertanoniae TaxID=1266829 RepID=A0A4R4PQU5_9ACTN|nr:DUF4082 domain-containing protein [Kribbella albertanoniae]TDC24680.1 DUF4082 domain-containing protein [Kribbella albertanoniae]